MDMHANKFDFAHIQPIVKSINLKQFLIFAIFLILKPICETCTTCMFVVKGVCSIKVTYSNL